jgi:hypothetical protein
VRHANRSVRASIAAPNPQAGHPSPIARNAKARAIGVEVCPHDVFEVGTIDETEFRALPFFARLKRRAWTAWGRAPRAISKPILAAPLEID